MVGNQFTIRNLKNKPLISQFGGGLSTSTNLGNWTPNLLSYAKRQESSFSEKNYFSLNTPGSVSE